MNEKTFETLRPFILMGTAFLTWMACLYVDSVVIPQVTVWINGPGMTAVELNAELNALESRFPADSLKVSP